MVRLSKEAIQLLGFITALIGGAFTFAPNNYLPAFNDFLTSHQVLTFNQTQFLALGILLLVVGFYAVVKAR